MYMHEGEFCGFSEENYQTRIIVASSCINLASLQEVKRMAVSGNMASEKSIYRTKPSPLAVAYFK